MKIQDTIREETKVQDTIERAVRNNDIEEVDFWKHRAFPELPICDPTNYFVTTKLYTVNGEKRYYEFHYPDKFSGDRKQNFRYYSHKRRRGRGHEWTHHEVPERELDEADGVILGTLDEKLLKKREV